MLSVSKTSQRERSSEILAAIIEFHSADELHMQIGAQLNLAKSSMTIIIKCYSREPTQPVRRTKRARRLLMLNER